MKIFILAATNIEVQPLSDHLTAVGTHDEHINRYIHKDLTIDIVVSGIGMVAKAYYLGRQLQSENYDLALNIGIAGSYKKEIPIGEVVNVVEDQFSEMGAEDGEGFISIVDMNFVEFDSFPYSKGKLINETDFVRFGLEDLIKTKGITSNTIHGRLASITDLIDKFNPDVETMGGAAFLFACLTESIPCAQIRSISNYVEVRDRSGWKVEMAIEQLTKHVMNVFEYLSK